MNLVPQFGFFELMMIAIVALVVVGPRDLPKLMRGAGKLVGTARRMAAEFTAAFDQMARESEMEELRKEIDALKSANPLSKAKDELDESLKPIADELRETSRQANEAGQTPAAKRHADEGAAKS